MMLNNTDFKLIANEIEKNPNHPFLIKLSKNMYTSYDLAEWLIKNDRQVPNQLIERISTDPHYSCGFAMFLADKNKEKEIPNIILNGVIRDSEYAYRLASFLLKSNKEVPEILYPSVAKNTKFSYELAKILVKYEKAIPDVIKQSANKDSMAILNLIPQLKENTFTKFYNELLLEMPYLFYLSNDNIPNDKQHFDLELEKYNTPDKLETYLTYLFSLGTKTDKYGNSIFINTSQDKKFLFRKIFHSKECIHFITKIGKFKSTDDAKKWLLKFNR